MPRPPEAIAAKTASPRLRGTADGYRHFQLGHLLSWPSGVIAFLANPGLVFEPDFYAFGGDAIFARNFFQARGE